MISPLLFSLPGILLCSPAIPSSAFTSLNENDNMVILDRRKEFCNGTVDPEVLAQNSKSSYTENLTKCKCSAQRPSPLGQEAGAAGLHVALERYCT